MIKVLVTEYSGGKFSIVSEGKESPEAGKRYYMFQADKRSLVQNNLFHEMLTILFRSCLWDSDPRFQDCKNIADLKDEIKRSLGEGVEYYEYYYSPHNKWFGRPVQVKTFEELPEALKKNFDKAVESGAVREVLKSSRKYTPKQMMNMIKNLGVYMLKIGVSSPKWDDIATEFDFLN